MIKPIIAACLLFIQLHSLAQYNDLGYFRQGEKYFAQKDYNAAAQYFAKYLTVDPKARPQAQPFALVKKRPTTMNPRQQATCHLAIAYMELHDFERAEKYWRLAAGFKHGDFPEFNYWYGKTLLANGKYEEAIAALTLFEKEYTSIGPILNDADRQLGNLRFIQQQQKQGGLHPLVLTRQSNMGNTTAYAMSVLNEDSLVFTAVPATGPPTNSLFELIHPAASSGSPGFAVRTDSNILTSASHITIFDSSSSHNGLTSFSPGGKTLFFTRWTNLGGINKAAIWSSSRSDSGWSHPVMAGAPINIPGSNSTQPFITGDGKFLLFASDRPGGYGGYDIWFAALDSNYLPLSASNLGDAINSPCDEASPYYHFNSHTLVFASNGRIGMGGFDCYYTKGYPDLFNWDPPRNPGAPINSTKDDLYFISTDEDNIWNSGWLSSDRDAGCCLALYDLRGDNRQFIAGSVLDCSSNKPLKNVRLSVTGGRHGKETLAAMQTDSLGCYRFSLKNTSRFHILLQKDGYTPKESAYIVHMQTGDDSITNDVLCLQPILPPAPAPKAVSSLGNWAYKRSALPPAVHHSLDSLVLLMLSDTTLVVQIEGYTDGIGGVAYNLRLAQARVDVCIRYMWRRGIAPARLRGKSFGKCCPLEPETIDGRDNPAGRERNRRVEYRILAGK